MDEMIAVYIGYSSRCSDSIIKEISLGCEEEGVPHELILVEGDAKAMSEEVSMISKLDVGIGVDERGNIAIHHKKFPDGFYLFSSNYQRESINLRAIGANSARLVKGIPFKEIRD